MVDGALRVVSVKQAAKGSRAATRGSRPVGWCGLASSRGSLGELHMGFCLACALEHTRAARTCTRFMGPPAAASCRPACHPHFFFKSRAPLCQSRVELLLRQTIKAGCSLHIEMYVPIMSISPH